METDRLSLKEAFCLLKLRSFEGNDDVFLNIAFSLQKFFTLLKSEPQDQQRKRHSIFLVNFLQDLERRIMNEFERGALVISGREVDVYIHDGCLIRKQMVGDEDSLLSWDMDTLASKGEDAKFENFWTDDQLLPLVEAQILENMGIKVKFLVSNLDTKEFERRLEARHLLHLKGKHLQPPKKTEEELFYYCETYMNLCYITERDKYLYCSDLLTWDSLKHVIEEPYYRFFKPFSRTHQNNDGLVYQEVEGNFLEAYLKRSDRKKFSRIELVRKNLHSRLPSSSKQKSRVTNFQSNFGLGAFRLTSTNPFKVLTKGKGKTEKTLFLLDLNEGYPLFNKENYLNDSLESAGEFLCYLSQKSLDSISGLNTKPLFPSGLFESEKLVFEQHPLAVPYYNHWWILLGKN